MQAAGPLAGDDGVATLALAIGEAREPVGVYRALRDFVRVRTALNGFLVSRYDAERRLRVCLYAFSDGVETDSEALPPLPLNGSPNSRAIQTRRPVVVRDYQEAVQGLPVVWVASDVNPRRSRSALAVPMLAHGNVVGVLSVQSLEPDAFTPLDVQNVQTAANLAALAIENLALLHARTEELARATAELRGQSVARGLVRRMLWSLARDRSVRPQTLRALGRELAGGLSGMTAPEAVAAYAGMGLGVLRSESRERGRYVFEGHELLEREEQSAQPTCFLSLGYLEGVVAALEGREALGTEVACQSRGHAACRFVVAARDPS